MKTTADQLIITTCTLMEEQGYHATGLNQILAESGAPKGLLYYPTTTSLPARRR